MLDGVDDPLKPGGRQWHRFLAISPLETMVSCRGCDRFAGTAYTLRAGVAARGTYPSAAFDIPECIDSAVRGHVIVIDAGA
jgi:regulator of RNase E activity RraA